MRQVPPRRRALRSTVTAASETLTIMFTDLVDSTSIRSAIGEERADELCELILAHSQSGRRGDGKVFLLPVSARFET